jgi:SOS-response transcriptional repressor LexA
MLGLTRKQHEALTYFRGIAEAGGRSPTYSEIANALGLRSKSGAFRIVEALCERGFLERMPHRHQSVRLHPSPPAYVVPAEVQAAEHPPADQSKRAETRRCRTYVVELEEDLHRRLRALARKSDLPPEHIMAAAVRWYVMEPENAVEVPKDDESRPAGC